MSTSSTNPKYTNPDFIADLLQHTGCKTVEDARGWVIDCGEEQILSDIADGKIPDDVDFFADLHDQVDANGYGKAFDWPCTPGEDRSDDEAYLTDFSRFWNDVQDVWNEWIVSGEMADAAETARGLRDRYEKEREGE